MVGTDNAFVAQIGPRTLRLFHAAVPESGPTDNEFRQAMRRSDSRAGHHVIARLHRHDLRVQLELVGLALRVDALRSAALLGVTIDGGHARLV